LKRCGEGAAAVAARPICWSAAGDPDRGPLPTSQGLKAAVGVQIAIQGSGATRDLRPKCWPMPAPVPSLSAIERRADDGETHAGRQKAKLPGGGLTAIVCIGETQASAMPGRAGHLRAASSKALAGRIDVSQSRRGL